MSRHRKSIAATLVSSAALLHGVAAHAQDARGPTQQPDEATEVETIIVHGSRAQNLATIQSKRDTTGVSDFLTQDELGQMPDLNLAESLRRVPGVTAVFEEDRGYFAVVRGLDPNFNVVAVDGLNLATSDGGAGNARRVYLSVIPTTAASAVEVRKTFTPDIDGGSIGGYINLRTRSAFDRVGPFFVAEVGANYFTYQGVPDVGSGFDPISPWGGQANVTFANTFGSNDEFGVVLSANWQRTERDEKKIIQSDSLFFDAQGRSVVPLLPDRTVNPAWNGWRAPSNMRRYTYHNSTENYGLSAKLEYRPNNAFQASVLGFLYREEYEETRKALELWAATLVQNQTATSGALTYSRADIGWIANAPKTQNAGVLFNAGYDFSELAGVTFRSGLTSSSIESREDSILYRNTRAQNRRLNYTQFDLGPTTFYDIAVEDVPALLNTNNYVLNNYSFNERDYRDQVFDTLIDYSYNRGDGSTAGWGMQAGAEYRSSERDKDINYGQFVENGSTLTPYAIQTDYAPGRLNYPELWIDGRAFLAIMPGTLAADANDTRNTSSTADFFYKEDSIAGYGLVSFRTDRMEIVWGVRYETIDVTARAPDTTLTDVTRTGGYDAWLPSATLAFDLTDDWRLKLGASRSLGRPAPASVAQREVRNDLTFTISRGNPDLQPRRATNLDVGLEYYFPDGDAMMSAGLFYKEIDDEIFNMSQQVRLDFNGVSQEYTLTTPQNAQGATLQGVELSYIDNALDFLPGFLRNVGVYGNVTYVDGEIAYRDVNGDFRVSDRLLEQPSWYGNASIFYNHHDLWEARLSYNYKGRYLDEINVQPHRIAGFREQHNVDLAVRYDVSDNWVVKFQARNLLGEDRLRVRGFNLDEGREDIEFGRSAFLNLVYSY